MKFKQIDNNRKIFECILLIVGLAICECIFFRELLWGDKFPGGDTALIMMECDHWYDVLKYGHGLTEMRAFWPVNHWLGGSDMMLGEGLLHSFLRLIGCDLFSAYIATVVVTHFTGVIFLWVFLRNIGVKRIGVIAAEIMSFFSCSFVSFSGHSQFFSYSYIAVLFWALERIYHYRSDHEKGNRSKRYFYEFIAILYYGLSFLTAFYVGYFMTIWMGLTALVLAVICRKKVKALLVWVKDHIMESFICVVAQIWWIYPFCKVYLPMLSLSGGGYGDEEVALFSADWSDILRTISKAPLERLWNSYVRHSLSADMEMWRGTVEAEVSSGYPVITVLLFVLSLVLLIKVLIRSKAEVGIRTGMLSAMAVSTLLCFCIFLKTGDFSIWITLRSLVPGGSSVRAVGRIIGMMCLPIAVVTAGGSYHAVRKKNKAQMIALIGVIIILIISNICDMPVQFDISEMRDSISSVTQAPDDCKVMIILDETDVTNRYSTQMKSWMIASENNLYTVNGYSGNFPPGWNLAYTSDEGDYLNRVISYLDIYGATGMDGIYIYDTGIEKWIPLNSNE